MEFNEQILFFGGINTDDDPRELPEGDYRDFSYCRLGTVSGGGIAVVTSWGTVDISNPLIPGEDQVIGATIWEKYSDAGVKRAVIYFVWGFDGDHQIWLYDIDAQQHELVLESAELNFSKQFPIIHANCFGDIVKWTDGRWDDQIYLSDGTRLFNPPYQINIQKALDGFYSSVSLRTIDAIKWPAEPPVAEYISDINKIGNDLGRKLYKFSVQYLYENNETSAWSMFSNLALPDNSEFVSGTNWIDTTLNNAIKVTVNTGPKEVIGFSIALQQFDEQTGGAEGPFSVFSEYKKDTDNISDDVLYEITYYGNTSTKPAVDFLKNYDRLPITARCQQFLPTSQIAYINFREGYDAISLNCGSSTEISEITDYSPWGSFSYSYAYSASPGLAYFSTRSVSQGGWNVNDTFPYEAGMVISANRPTSTPGTISYKITQDDIDAALALPAVLDKNEYILQVVGDAFMSQLGYSFGTVAPGLTPNTLKYSFTSAPDTYPSVQLTNITKFTHAKPSLKIGARHEFGIVYGDRAFRDGSVLTSPSLNIDVPWYYDEPERASFFNSENPYRVSPVISITHQPPKWADRYWIVTKSTTNVLSFGHFFISAGEYENAIAQATPDAQNAYPGAVYALTIDNWYTNTYNPGATINHTPSVGDKLRFIRKRPFPNAGIVDTSDPNQYRGGQYAPYLEVDVVGYSPDGGLGARPIVYVSYFDISIIENFGSSTVPVEDAFGYLVEIYTPRPYLDDDGSLFTSQWRDVTPAIPIIDPHTGSRRHGVYADYIVRPQRDGLVWEWVINGDLTNLIGEEFNGVVYYNNGDAPQYDTEITILSATYDPSLSLTTLTFSGTTPPVAGGTVLYLGLTKSSEQTLTPVAASAILKINYGDVYVRQRDFNTGYAQGSSHYYYYIEDYNYSDYWLSDVHEEGRVRIELENPRTLSRVASAIHSNPFGGINSTINGTSSFVLDNSNIIDMNPQFGEVVRAVLSGREGKTLKCLQPFKENSIYIQYYPNEVGSEQSVRVSERTFASWFDYKSRFGCSSPESVSVLPDGSVTYFDSVTGSFILSGGNGQMVISEIDRDSGRDYKFRKKTKELTLAYNAGPGSSVKSYVNETMGEVGFGFQIVDDSTSSSGDLVFANDEYAVLAIPEGYTANEFYEYLTQFTGREVIFYITSDNPEYPYTTFVSSIQYVEPPGLLPPIGIALVLTDMFPESGTIKYEIPPQTSYQHVVFDYVGMRWRSTYDYQFLRFVNYGQFLFGWKIGNSMFRHNEKNSFTFHGEPFVQKIVFESNENPASIKRYQNMVQMSSKTFFVKAYSGSNLSYPTGMYTEMPVPQFGIYEGYSKIDYKKNLYDPKFYSSGGAITSSFNPPDDPVNGWTIAGDQTGLLGVKILIIQGDVKFLGDVLTAVYDDISNTTKITLAEGPSSNGVPGIWYKADLAMFNGEDMRSYSLTHELSYDPSENEESASLYSVAIKGVLS